MRWVVYIYLSLEDDLNSRQVRRLGSITARTPEAAIRKGWKLVREKKRRCNICGLEVRKAGTRPLDKILEHYKAQPRMWQARKKNRPHRRRDDEPTDETEYSYEDMLPDVETVKSSSKITGIF